MWAHQFSVYYPSGSHRTSCQEERIPHPGQTEGVPLICTCAVFEERRIRHDEAQRAKRREDWRGEEVSFEPFDAQFFFALQTCFVQ